MEALFFNFSKRRNSTKVPEDSSGTSFKLYLKQDTSLRNPTFVISADTFGFNYCKFNGAYYFVTDVISHKNDLWYVVCEIDDLATLRSEILASSAFVLYDTAANSEIVDGRLAVKTTPTVQSNAVAFPSIDKNIGRYIVSCIGTNSTDSWAIPYRMSPSALITAIFNKKVYDSLDEDEPSLDDFDNLPETATPADVLRTLGQNFRKNFNFTYKFEKKAWSQQLSSGDAMNCIKSCIWLPFDFSTTGSDIIWLGKYDTGCAATKMGTSSDPAIKTLSTITLQIPWQFSDWRNTSPYTQLYLYIPFIGITELSGSSLKGAVSIDITPALNVISGDLAIRVSCGSQTIGTYGANVAVPVPLGSSNATPAQMLNSLLAGATGAAIGAASGNMIAIGAAALNGIAGATLSAIAGHPSTVGGLSSGAAVGLLTNIVIFSVCHDTVVTPSSVASTIGLPTFAVKSLANVSGYVQTAEFSLQAAADGPALDAVNAALNGGAFIE